MEMSHQSGAEAESLLRPDQRNAVFMPGHRQGRWDGADEKSPFLRNEPVKLTPAWEGANLPNDTLNLKGIAMDLAPPKDKWNLIYMTLIIHGLGTLIGWNMFITAKKYFEDYKLISEPDLKDNFMTYIGWASQIPNLIFNWLNVFIQMGGSLTTRIVWSLTIEVLLFVITIVLAMVDSADWTVAFFWFTIVTVFLLNTFNAIFQNSVYGMAARLPPSYTGAVVLGSNVCGTLVSLLSMATEALQNVRTAAIYYFIGGMFVLLICFDTFFALPLNVLGSNVCGTLVSLLSIATEALQNVRTAAIYYFIGGMFVLLICFDTFFALPLHRFYRYHDTLQQRTLNVNPALAATNPNASPRKQRTPYGTIFLQSAVQLYNIFITFFVSLAVFPAVMSGIQPINKGFLGGMFVSITCFLTFNLTAMVGNITASLWQFPGPRLLPLLTTARLVFIPFFLLCNYQVAGRQLPVLITNDWVYWVGSALLGWSSGHASSLGMMYVSRNVAPEHSSKAGMIGAAMLVTGIVSGITAGRLGPLLVSSTFESWGST